MSHAVVPSSWFARVFDPNHELLVAGTPDEQMRARREWQRERVAQAIIAKWDEIPRERLAFGRHWIEDVQTGNLYRPFHGDPHFAGSVLAYYLTEDGWPIMLEPSDPPSRAAMEERQAAREQRRADRAAAARTRYAELRGTSR